MLEEFAQGFNPLIRLAPGVARDVAQAELDIRAASLSSTEAAYLSDVRDVIYLTAQPASRFLLGSAVLVFLIGCAHLSSLFLARSHQRSRETGIRCALGASRMRLIRPELLEALLLGIGGGAIAGILTFLTVDLVLPLIPANVYGVAPVGFGPRVVLFAIALGVVGGLLFSAVPAWRSSRRDPLAVLLQRGLRTGPGKNFGWPMVVAQVALSLVLVSGLALSAQTLLALRTSIGFSPENVAVVAFGARYQQVAAALEADPDDAGPAIQAFWTAAAEAVSGLADVVSVGAVGSRPFDNSGFDEGVGGPAGGAIVGLDHVLPGYFSAAGIELLRGRPIVAADYDSGARVAVLSESGARALYGRADPLGRTFTNDRGQFTVVGVVSDVVKNRGSASPLPGGYVLPGRRTPRLQLIVRTRLKSTAVMDHIESEVAALVPGTPLRVTWWDEAIRATGDYQNPRFATLVLGGFAAVALGLTAAGLAGLVAFIMASRRSELGIRLALGAGSASLTRLMIRRILLSVLAGVGVGLAVSPLLARLAESQLFAVDAASTTMVFAAVLTVLVVAVFATWLPARRVGQIDPARTLRAQ